MEEQLNYEEWFFQSDYDLETAYHMMQSGRNVYGRNNSAMDKEPLIKDKETALEIITYMQQALIKDSVAPCHIALFGSFLHGNYHAESDLDMIIISESFEGKDDDQRIYMTINAEKEVRKKYIVPMDILLKTPEEYNNPQKRLFDSKIVV